VILRFVDPKQAAFHSLTAELFIDGSAKFYIPIQYCPEIFFEENLDEFETQEVRETLWQLTQDDTHRHAKHMKFFNMKQLWVPIAMLFTYYYEWLKDEPILEEFRIAIAADGIFRAVPVYDHVHWAEQVKKFGFPVVLKKKIRMPSDMGRGIPIERKPLKKGVPGWIAILGFIGFAFGLPKESFFESYMSALIQTGQKNPIEPT
jgi:hypothetical protein